MKWTAKLNFAIMCGNFCLLDLYLHNQIVQAETAFQARRINVKDEMFIREWDKQNVRVPSSD